MRLAKATLIGLALLWAAWAQGEDPWKDALARVQEVHSYQLEVKATHHHEVPQAGSGSKPDLGVVSRVMYQEPARLRIDEVQYRDGALRKPYAKAAVLYDGQFDYIEFHSAERDQRIKQSMKKWIESGHPFQGDYPNWGTCFLEKEDYLGTIRKFAALPDWREGPEVNLQGKACRTLEREIREDSEQLPVCYRVYLDREGWMRGLDTYYPESNPAAPVHLWRMRYQNIKVNPTLDPGYFQVKNPASFQSRD